MQQGDEISPTLNLAMDDSTASLIILSINYANSSWCLDELALLCDLRSSLKRPMIHILYGVNPSDVRKRESFLTRRR
ncbi:hypothetical protein ARALYDRAFT_899175 [Arabidopsis lyrata subsp. lyrata]|uniref:TIR domain-containing protein n=1 Tax=Arabidopsis lyrata subsp. lyrata TaxID=81972 RepID=D7L6V6_ARALL|nr:hypothetical protein ARALYDRAFT_899175 [Arabidopsis lyrata subsp. lyrata]